MLLYKSKILVVNYLEVQYLIHADFKQEAKNLSLEELKAELEVFLEKRVRRRGRHLFFDMRNIEEKIDKDFLVWLHSRIVPEIFSLKGNNEALFFTSDYIDKIDVPKFFVVRNKLLEVRKFDNPKAAMDWLLEGAERRRLGLSGHRHKH